MHKTRTIVTRSSNPNKVMMVDEEGYEEEEDVMITQQEEHWDIFFINLWNDTSKIGPQVPRKSRGEMIINCSTTSLKFHNFVVEHF